MTTTSRTLSNVMEPWFKFSCDPPRSTTRQQWRVISRFSRITAKLVMKESERIDFAQFEVDLLVHGQAFIRVGKNSVGVKHADIFRESC